jgi:predicted transcriptional regulator
MSTAVLEQPKRKRDVVESPVTWDSLHPDLQQAILEGEADIAAGRVYTNDEMKEWFDQWKKEH